MKKLIFVILVVCCGCSEDDPVTSVPQNPLNGIWNYSVKPGSVNNWTGEFILKADVGYLSGIASIDGGNDLDSLPITGTYTDSTIDFSFTIQRNSNLDTYKFNGIQTGNRMNGLCSWYENNYLRLDSMSWFADKK